MLLIELGVSPDLRIHLVHLSLMLLPREIALNLLQAPHLVVNEVSLLGTTFILLHNKVFELPLTNVTRLERYYFGLRQVNHVLLERIGEHLVVAVLCLLGKREIKTLRNIVLAEEVGAELRHFLVGGRVVFGEEIARQRLVHITLRRVRHGSRQQSLLRLVITEATRHLVLVDERELGAGRVQVHLMNQVICDTRVLDQREAEQEDGGEHCREHGRVRLVERVLANQVDAHADWYDVLHVQVGHTPPLRSMIVQQVVAVLQLEDLLKARRIDA